MRRLQASSNFDFLIYCSQLPFSVDFAYSLLMFRIATSNIILVLSICCVALPILRQKGGPCLVYHHLMDGWMDWTLNKILTSAHL